MCAKNSTRTQTDAIFDQLKVAPGVGVLIKCANCGRITSDSGATTPINNFINSAFEQGWRYGYTQDAATKGTHCPECSASHKDFTPTTN
jgi:DNA-directed RNA polymerase subunit RPC12/RpoP